MAHALAEDLIAQQGWPMVCHSAGIRAQEGNATTPEAVQVLAAHGIAWCGKSRQLTKQQLLAADLVWAMTAEHLAYAQALLEDSAAAQRPLMCLLAAPDEVEDPLGCGLSAYEELYACLQAQLPSRLRALVPEPQA